MAKRLGRVFTTIIYSTAFLATGGMAWAHCDTMSGPVITEAKGALAKGDVTPVLKWVSGEKERDVRQAFADAIEARKSGGKAAEVAERWFFETLVRIHREGEGAPFTGISAGGVEEPAIAEADKALASGSDEALLGMVAEKVREGIHHRFLEAQAKKKTAGNSVEAGREFVEAYVQFIHYGEGIYQAADRQAVHHSPQAQAEPPGHAGHGMTE